MVGPRGFARQRLHSMAEAEFSQRPRPGTGLVRPSRRLDCTTRVTGSHGFGNGRTSGRCGGPRTAKTAPPGWGQVRPCAQEQAVSPALVLAALLRDHCVDISSRHTAFRIRPQRLGWTAWRGLRSTTRSTVRGHSNYRGCRRSLQPAPDHANVRSRARQFTFHDVFHKRGLGGCGDRSPGFHRHRVLPASGACDRADAGSRGRLGTGSLLVSSLVEHYWDRRTSVGRRHLQPCWAPTCLWARSSCLP